LSNKAFIFDLDGTILFLAANWNRVKARLVELYSSYGIEMNLEDITNIFRNIDETEEKIKPEKEKKVFRKKAFNIIEDEEIKGVKDAHFREGAPELLDFLKNEKLAIVSSNSRSAANQAFNVLRIDGSLFKSIIMRDDVDRLKPDPQGIVKAIKHLKSCNGNLKKFFYIGDQKNDVIAAKQASKFFDDIEIKTIAVCGGASKEEKIRAQNPDFFTYNLHEVKNVIQDLLK
jgi:phosphoglycolate phosphatase